MNPRLRRNLLLNTKKVIRLSDNFNDNTIDLNKWLLTNPGGWFSEVNNRLEIDVPRASTVALFVNELRSIKIISSKIIAASCNLTWTTDADNEAGVGIFLVDITTNTNYCKIMARSTPGGVYVLAIIQNGTIVYSFDTTITKGKDVKINYNTYTSEISFWYWNVNQWTQMGTTKIYNIGNSMQVVLTSQDATFINGADPGIIDNLYFQNKDFNTQYP